MVPIQASNEPHGTCPSVNKRLDGPSSPPLVLFTTNKLHYIIRLLFCQGRIVKKGDLDLVFMTFLTCWWIHCLPDTTNTNKKWLESVTVPQGNQIDWENIIRCLWGLFQGFARLWTHWLWMEWRDVYCDIAMGANHERMRFKKNLKNI